MFEYEAAGPAIARKTRARVEAGEKSSLSTTDITTELVVRSALAGDELAGSILDEAASYLGMGVANIISILNPQVVVLGGGLMNAGEYLLERIRCETKLWAQPLAAEQCRIELTRLGDEAGLLGAARLAFLNQSK
jgi:glucokinase